MKYIKILGLAVVAAMALTAFIGASSASATVLCKQTPTGSPAKCPAANTYGSGTVIEGVATNATLTSTIGVVCSESKTSVKTTNTGGAAATVTGTIESLTFTGCKEQLFKTSCTVKSVNTPYAAETHWTESTHNGTLTASDDGNGEPGASVSCPFVGINCVFGAEPTLDIIGGNPANVVANEEELTIKEESGFFECPEEGFWDATYVSTGTNKAVWVAQEEE